MIKGILFDKDGTLIEFERTWHSIMTLLFAKIEQEGIFSKKQLMEIKEVTGYTEHGFEKESKIQFLANSTLVDLWLDICESKTRQTLKDKLLTLFGEASIDQQVKIILLPHTQEMVEYLSGKYHLGIATADTQESTIHSLQQAGLLHYFQYIGADNGENQSKPHPMMADQFCRQTRIDSCELLIVGDSVSDYQFAKNAKASFVGISNDYGVLSSLQQDFPLVADLKEMVNKLQL